MNFSIIKKSQLEGNSRLDAEYYQPEYLDIKKTLQKFNSLTIKELIRRPVVTGSTPKIRDCKNDGTDIKFIKTDTLRDGEIIFDYADCLPKDKNREISQLKDGDVIVTIIGATYDIVGRSALVFDNDPLMNINQNIALIRPNENITPAYLETFLRGKYGRLQLWQQSRQTEQVNLNCREVENVLVPLFPKHFQNSIALLIKESRVQKLLANKFNENAENLLLKELGLEDFKPKEDLSFVINFSEVEKANRMDANYFQPKYAEILERIKNTNGKKLEDLASIKKGIEPGSEAYQEKGKHFIRVSSLSKNGIDNKDQKYLSEDLYQQLKADFKPKVGEIILTKDATPGVAFVIKENIEGIISGGILRLQLKEEIEPEYLALCLNSIIGKMQAEKDCGGSIIIHWRPEQIKNVSIPILPKNTQQKIADLVRKSHEARKKSKELLNEAKRKVEEMIEKGDKK